MLAHNVCLDKTGTARQQCSYYTSYGNVIVSVRLVMLACETSDFETTLFACDYGSGTSCGMGRDTNPDSH